MIYGGDMKSNENDGFSIRQCDAGCVVLGFGHTTVHLDARNFAHFAEVFQNFLPQASTRPVLTARALH